MNKGRSYVEDMLRDKNICVAKQDGSYFNGSNEYGFVFSKTEYKRINSKEELLGILVLLNYDSDNATILERKNDSFIKVNLNEFITDELSASVKIWSEFFNSRLTNFINENKFKISFIYNNEKVWVKDMPLDFVVKSVQDLEKAVTPDESDAGVFSIEDFKKQKNISSTKEVQYDVLEICSTAQFKIASSNYDYILNHAFQLLVRDELKNQLETEKASRN